jgi:hypothetical protein
MRQGLLDRSLWVVMMTAEADGGSLGLSRDGDDDLWSVADHRGLRSFIPYSSKILKLLLELL